MKNKLTISIITPTYNSEGTLHDTLRSVAGQRYDAIEHLIVDGASTDKTASIVSDYQHVSRFLSESDKGLYDAMNKGLKMATGDVIGILNSDDFYAHNRVLERVAELFAEPGTMAVYGDLNYVDAIDTDEVVRHWKAGEFNSNQFLYGWMPPHPSFFVRREVYDACGSFNTRFRYAADYELMLRFLFKHKYTAAYLPEVLVHMRTGGVSNSSLRNRWKANREDRMAWEVNGLKPYFFTIPLKPFRKIGQFLIK